MALFKLVIPVAKPKDPNLGPDIKYFTTKRLAKEYARDHGIQDPEIERQPTLYQWGPVRAA